jgi:hypothetical protein
VDLSGGPSIVRNAMARSSPGALAWREGDAVWTLREMPAVAWSSGGVLFGVTGKAFYTSSDASVTWAAIRTGPVCRVPLVQRRMRPIRDPIAIATRLREARGRLADDSRNELSHERTITLGAALPGHVGAHEALERNGAFERGRALTS